MSDSKLEILKKNREALLLAEIVALLHDVGKLSSQFIDQMSREPSPASKTFEHERAVKTIFGFVDRELLGALENKRLRDLLRWPYIDSKEQLGQILDLILYHDRSRHSAFLVRLLNRCDGIDSGADKGTTRDGGLPKEAKQPVDATFGATAFGSEFVKIDTDTAALDKTRTEMSGELGKALSPLSSIAAARPTILGHVLRAYQMALGETRRSANDVTLWDHSFSVGTLYKSALATFAVKKSLDIDKLRWRLLRINFDVLGLYAKAIKIGDLLAYQGAVQRACEAVKRLVEEEYPLGNEVYRDATGIYFTFPDLDDLDLRYELEDLLCKKIEEIEPELAPRIAVEQGKGNTASEQLKTLLSEGRKQALGKLAYPFDDENMSDYWGEKWREAPASSEVCPVCRLRPMKKGTEVCGHCLERRKSRIEWWQQHPSETIWLDEIADNNDRIALIVGKFGLDGWLSGDLVQTMLVQAVENEPDECKPKNPSPARLRRVWETCERFWTETVVREILGSYEYGKGTKNPALRRTRLLISPDNKKDWCKNTPYDGIINGHPISLLWDDRQQQFLTIVNLQLAAGDETVLETLVQKWHGQEVEVSDPDNLRRRLRFKVQSVAQPSDKFASYQPTLTVLTSPDQFLAFIPASDALNVLEKIRQEYIRQFGKVQNRLPLFLGLVFFQRKTPLVAVIDTARRMLEQVSLSEESWIVESNDPSSDGLKRQVFLLRNGQQVIFEIPVKMGDDVTEDIWYPYFFVADGTEINSCKLRFQHNGRWLVHVNDLRKGDHVYVIPSRFAYLFLESAAQRFRFDPEKHVLLLDDLTRLMTMWESVCRSPEMSQTKLQAIQAFFRSKRQLWRLDETKTPDYAEREKTFRQLVETTLNRSKVQGVSVNEVMNGLFGHCLELYLHILKRKVEEEEHEQEPATV